MKMGTIFVKILKATFLVLFAVISCSTTVVAITNQKVTFYSEVNKQGSPYSITNSENVIPNSEIANSQSFCVDIGLWKTTLDAPTSSAPTSEVHYGGTLGSEYCRNRNIVGDDDRWAFTSWEYVGELDLETPSLSLFERANYLGNFTFIGPLTPRISLSRVVEFNSYFITGTSNWAVYNETEFGGSVTCLTTVVSGNLFGAKGLQMVNPSMRVGSIVRGCAEDAFTSTRKPLPGDTSGAVHAGPSGWFMCLIISWVGVLFTQVSMTRQDFNPH